MSSSGQDQTPGGEKPHGFSKFVRRASKVLKPKPNRNSLASERGATIEEAPTTAHAAGLTPAVTPKPTEVPSTSAQKEVTSRPKAPAAPRRSPSPKIELIRSTPTTAAAHYRLQEEKARALFAKYNLALEPGEWAPARSAKNEDWVEKTVRMRVHRECHRCNTAFGSEKICQKCHHTRCKKCPRYPDKSATAKDRKEKGVSTVMVDSNPKYQGLPKRTKPVPTMMSKGGQEMLRRQPVHRVRRTCHKCEALFVGKATECAGCKHQRCPKCPREPAKTKKYPNGYPGDVEETFPLAERTLKQTRQRVRWECHSCKKTFVEHERVCRGCDHERCGDCQRWPPKKIKPEPHPDVIRGLEEKLARAQLSPAA